MTKFHSQITDVALHKYNPLVCPVCPFPLPPFPAILLFVPSLLFAVTLIAYTVV